MSSLLHFAARLARPVALVVATLALIAAVTCCGIFGARWFDARSQASTSNARSDMVDSAIQVAINAYSINSANPQQYTDRMRDAVDPPVMEGLSADTIISSFRQKYGPDATVITTATLREAGVSAFSDDQGTGSVFVVLKVTSKYNGKDVSDATPQALQIDMHKASGRWLASAIKPVVGISQ